MTDEELKTKSNIDQLRYTQDARWPIKALYDAYDRLFTQFGFQKVLIASQRLTHDNETQAFPIYGFASPIAGKDAVWIFSGVHGEEPPGPMAIADCFETIGKYGQQKPIVVAPLCNPLGYFRGWRYQDSKRGDKEPYTSVGDSEHLLLNQEKNGPRNPNTNSIAKQLTAYILKISQTHIPQISLDLHEDEHMNQLVLDDGDEGGNNSWCYIYSQGRYGSKDPIGNRVLEVMERHDMKRVRKGKTRFPNETIENGMVVAPQDGSLDELMASSEIWDPENQKPLAKPAAETVLVVETPVLEMTLPIRVATHKEIIESVLQ